MNATLTTTTDATATTITLAGDISDADVLNVAFGAAMAAVETAEVVVDIAGVTALGMAGVGLVFGAYRTAPWGCAVACCAGQWAPTVRLLGRRAIEVR